MKTLTIPVEKIDADYLDQLDYAMAFVDEKVTSYRLDKEKQVLEVDLPDLAGSAAIEAKVNELVERYKAREFGLPSVVFFANKKEMEATDAYQLLIDAKWVTPVGTGHAILRGPAAQLMQVIQKKIDREFAHVFGAELELYPSTIDCKTLDRTNHFISFPEHVDFVSGIKGDLEVINGFVKDCKAGGWETKLHENRMSEPEFAISPSCCYHAYEGMEGWDLGDDGRCITATLGCHRFERSNHATLSRLRAFTMREVVWVGSPDYVMDNRRQGDALIEKWAQEWDLSCSFETANDMFFTDDYAIKASFQRRQQGKKELRADIPQDKRSISIFSSNFHSNTFGKAFHIKARGRDAASGCIAWGLERWIYGIVSQFGLDIRTWPDALRKEMETQMNHGY